VAIEVDDIGVLGGLIDELQNLQLSILVSTVDKDSLDCHLPLLLGLTGFVHDAEATMSYYSL
jgi:hypothetical protein